MSEKYIISDICDQNVELFGGGHVLGRQDGAENCQTPQGQGLHHGSFLAVLLLDGLGKWLQNGLQRVFKMICRNGLQNGLLSDNKNVRKLLQNCLKLKVCPNGRTSL